MITTFFKNAARGLGIIKPVTPHLSYELQPTDKSNIHALYTIRDGVRSSEPNLLKVSPERFAHGRS